VTWLQQLLGFVSRKRVALHAEKHRWDGVYDEALVLATLALCLLGVVMVFSATVVLPDGPKYGNYSQYHFLIRHSAALLVGIVMGVVVFSVPTSFWHKIVLPALIAVVVMLFAVVLFGKTVNNAQRWFSFGGFAVQPSEFAKLALVCYCARYLDTVKQRAALDFSKMMPIVLVLGGVLALIMMQPDLGTSVVIAMTVLLILFLGNARLEFFLAMMGMLLVAVLIIIVYYPWRLERFKVVFDPWNEAYAQGAAYQLTHSLIAFGRGGYFGQGLGQSVEKLFYLPEMHTDFIPAIVAEELGLVGFLVVLGLLAFVIVRAFKIAQNAIDLDRAFCAHLARGVGLVFLIQVVISFFMNLGMLPTKGLTLPFISYGGSSLVTMVAAVAILLRIDFENRQLMHGGAGRSASSVSRSRGGK
jgi:cell division protein FtsW